MRDKGQIRKDSAMKHEEVDDDRQDTNDGGVPDIVGKLVEREYRKKHYRELGEDLKSRAKRAEHRADGRKAQVLRNLALELLQDAKDL